MTPQDINIITEYLTEINPNYTIYYHTTGKFSNWQLKQKTSQITISIFNSYYGILLPPGVLAIYKHDQNAKNKWEHLGKINISDPQFNQKLIAHFNEHHRPN